MAFNCPHCQKKIDVSISAPGGYTTRSKPGVTTLQSSQRTPFKNDAAVIPSVAPGYEIRNESASFLPTREAHVWVPLLRSLITGCYWGIIGGSVITLLNMQQVWGRVSAWGSLGYGLAWGGVLFFGTSFLYWITITGKYDGLLSRVETYTGVDIDGDGEVGQPEPPTVRLEVKEGHTWRFANLPGDDEALYSFARDVLQGIRTFSEQGADDNGYGVENFKKLRALFVEKGWAAWNHPTRKQQGASLTRSGKWILSEIASTPLPYRTPIVQNGDTVAGSSSQYERFSHI